MAHRRVLCGAVLTALVATAAGAAPGTALGTSKPRPGKYAGKEAFGTTPLPVSFRVSRNRSQVRKFMAQAQVRSGCTNHITSFQAPTGPMPISTDGRFAAHSRDYPEKGVRVRVVGRFVSRAKARGHISVRIAKHPGCDARRRFRARRVKPRN